MTICILITVLKPTTPIRERIQEQGEGSISTG